MVENKTQLQKKNDGKLNRPLQIVQINSKLKSFANDKRFLNESFEKYLKKSLERISKKNLNAIISN